MRVYLDTNILAFLVGQDMGNSISRDVMGVMNDYETILLTSSVCAQELVHLVQIGKVRIEKFKDIRIAAETALRRIEEMGVAIVPTKAAHLDSLARLPLYDDHRDPNDRMIVAQAISDRIPLVSSDRKFSRYERYGLDFIYNDR